MASVAAYALCQSACSAGWVSCYGAAGLVAGTVTAGIGVPAAVAASAAACNGACGTCMAACAAKFLAEGAAETAATGGFMGPAIAIGGAVVAGGAWLVGCLLRRRRQRNGASIVAPSVGASVGLEMVTYTDYHRLTQCEGFPLDIQVRDVGGLTGTVVGIAEGDIFVDFGNGSVHRKCFGDLQVCEPGVATMVAPLHPIRRRRRDVMKRAFKSLVGKA
mmetsp:Transcript_42255/g.119494  ORF Transcript_42255/g.119494 Transcript_42255/m.119494 type:complete len:218 (-) Transcript_42255:157-810(-)